jgi:predicted dithiol-disulfide oxidoreductase (DUF899 family)
MYGNDRNLVQQEITLLEGEIETIRDKIKSLRSDLPLEKVNNYKFEGKNGPISLLELFGNKDELIVIHNMGPQCAYCTLWADGFVSLAPYLKDRCSFVLETEVPYSELESFKNKRGWNFDCVSSKDTTFKKDMDFKRENSFLPGVSTFHKNGENIYRHATAPFGPGDDFCSVWHLFDLLKYGQKDWKPKYNK